MVARSSFKLSIGAVATVVAVALVIAGCGSSSSSSTSSAAAAGSTATSSSTPTSTSSTAQSGSGEMLHTAKGAQGTFLIAGNRALYLWVADTNGKSVCSGACAKAWPPVITNGKPEAGTGVNAADLGTTMRADGTEQVTYKGHPLYYFIADKGPGQTKGQGSNSFGAKWWLVTPSGQAITASGSAGGSSAGSSTSSSGGGWG